MEGKVPYGEKDIERHIGSLLSVIERYLGVIGPVSHLISEINIAVRQIKKEGVENYSQSVQNLVTFLEGEDWQKHRDEGELKIYLGAIKQGGGE